MRNELEETVKTARQLSDNWYEQRTIILKFIEAWNNNHPDKYDYRHIGDINDKLFQVILISYNNEIYFWWDTVISGVIECSGLEKAISAPSNGKIKTRVIWNSDPDDKAPVIPNMPIKFN